MNFLIEIANRTREPQQKAELGILFKTQEIGSSSLKEELFLGFWTGCSKTYKTLNRQAKNIKKPSFKTSISGITGYNRSEEILLQSLMAFLSWLSDFILGASKLTITKSEASWFFFENEWIWNASSVDLVSLRPPVLLIRGSYLF